MRNAELAFAGLRASIRNAALTLQNRRHVGAPEVATALEQDSGLKALAGTGDMREVQAAAQRRDPDAILALDVYTHRLGGSIAAMTAATAGLDALVFTGGVGEHSPQVRRRAAERLALAASRSAMTS